MAFQSLLMHLPFILLGILGLGVLVFIHELGHYFVAKWMKMKVEVFSIGFGRAILKWKRKDVVWQLGWVPFGGYVKIKGMELTKKGKEYVDPYTIPDGFFSKPPIKRIAVAIAGPIANFILAFICFFLLWATGGREKTFSEFTQYVGWVTPSSELYQKGVRPGDKITQYDSKSFDGAKDLVFAAMLSGDHVRISGDHVDWWQHTKKPFSYEITLEKSKGLRTIGASSASYLIYQPVKEGVYAASKTVQESGIEEGDRLVWMDGELLFSLPQLTNLLNKNYAFLMIKRGDKLLLTRQPRVLVRDLYLSSTLQGELEDYRYEEKILQPLSQLYILPYKIAKNGIVQDATPFIEEETKKIYFPEMTYHSLEAELLPNDEIISIDGQAFTTLAKMLSLLQTHRVEVMVQKKSDQKMSWKNEDQLFYKDLNVKAIEALSFHHAKASAEKNRENVRLLKPILPLTLDEFAQTEEQKKMVENNREQNLRAIAAEKDKKKRAELFKFYEAEQKKRLLGIALSDEKVAYNPSAFALFGDVFKETGQTLLAMVQGNLNPKWLSGPVGIIQVMQYSWKQSVKDALFWIGAISLNLGFLNLLPIPVLDGGYILMGLFELVTRKKISPKIMERVVFPFVILLIGLIIYLTLQDVSRLFG